MQAWSSLYSVYTLFVVITCVWLLLLPDPRTLCRVVGLGYLDLDSERVFAGVVYPRAVIGELDEALDSQLDLAVMKGEPLRPLVH
jgi:hypothetical protein